MLEIIRDLEAVRKKLNIPKLHFCDILRVKEPTYYRWLSPNEDNPKMQPRTKDHLERVLVELEKRARPLSEKFLDYLEVTFDHYTIGNSLIRSVSLFTLKRELDVDEDSIIETIHKLVKDGHLRLFPFPKPKNLNIHDLIFEFQIGTGTRTGFLAPEVMPDCNLASGIVTDARLFREDPLQPSERDPGEIRDVKGAIKTLRAGLQANLDKRIIKGSDGWVTEKEERRLDRIDETALRNATLKAGAKKE